MKVMSFNLRFGTARDGENQWKNRTDLVADVVREYQPDLLGTQETLPFQAEFLSEQFPEYERVGRSREADNPNGEQCALYFRRDRFDLLASGHFWLSDQPDHPGSRSWDSSLPRMATWVRLWDQENQTALLFINTHFDHVGKEARANSARLIRERAGQLAQGAAVVVTGDFNCGEGSLPHQNLTGVADAQLPLFDTFQRVHGDQAPQTGTFNGFQGKTDGARIDWILVSSQWEVNKAEIVDYQRDGRYPSDHFPVVTQLSIQSN